MKPPLVVDIETSGTPFDEGSLLTLSWQVVGEPHAHVARPKDVPGDVWGMLADPERPTVTHTKYDARFIILWAAAHSLRQGNEWEKALEFGRATVQGPNFDTQVMCWLDNENQSLALEQLVRRYCHIEMDKRLVIRKGVVFFRCDDESIVPIEEAPLDQLYAYNVRDVEATTELFVIIMARLEDSGWGDYWENEELPFTQVLLDMETEGLPIDLVRSESLREELEARHTQMHVALLASGFLPESFNLNSGHHLAAYLYGLVFSLDDTLDLGDTVCECLKSCLSGEHEDCVVPEDRGFISVHMVDCLPVGFVLDSVGRTQVKGHWRLKGRGIKPTQKTPKGDRWSTSAKVVKANLAAMRDEWVQEFLEYRRVDKALTTYLRRYPQVAVEVGPGSSPGYDGHDGPASTRIFARFNQTGTKTGRLSSSEPNLQNQPSHGELGSRMRDLFRPGEGRVLVVADASQLEPRLMGHYSQDPRLMAVYEPGGSGDVYTNMAEGVFGESNPERRGISKVLWLGVSYGAMGSRVGEILTINGYPTDANTGAGYLAELRNFYSRVFEWRDEVIARVHSTGFVRTIGGRKRRLKSQFEDRRNWKNVGYGERQAVNAIIQGSAGDVMRRLMLRQYGTFPEMDLLIQVHDELVSEVDDWWDRLEEYGHFLAGAHGFDLRVPLLFEPHVGESWYEGKEGAPLEVPDEWLDESTDYEEERSG